MSDKQQEISGDKPQETRCSDDIEMHEMESQLAEDEAVKESKERCDVMEEEEGACPQGTTEQEEMSQDGEGDQEEDAVVAGSDEGGGEGKEKTTDEEEMSQDEGDTIQNQQEEDVVAASSGEPGDEGGEGKIEATTGKEEQQPAEEGEEVMSQDEEDVPNKGTEPADADGGNGQVDIKGEEGRTGETAGDGQVDEERAGAAGADKGAKVEEVASQGSTSDSDSDSETYEFPDTLEEFKFHFKDGRLLSDENKPFVFEERKGKKKYNQARYEALGEVITKEVYKMLETETHLKKVTIPKRPKGNEPTSFIFMSEDALTNRDKLMILIHGSGVVRAGQWARSLIINDCIESGTQIPYIKRAMVEGYGVIVLNTNDNSGGTKGTPIRGSGSPKEHAQYVWKKFVKGAKAKDVYIVAHSFGGVVTVDLMTTGFKEFKKKVHKIAFTDSVHVLPSSDVPQNAQEWIAKHAVNWVTSDRPVNEELESYSGDVRRRSAGTLKHVETSWFSFEHIFAYFSEK